MESSTKRDCAQDGRTYSHGSEVCDLKKCMRCNDGEWEDRFEDLIMSVGP